MRPPVKECCNYWLAVAEVEHGAILRVVKIFPALGRDSQAQQYINELNTKAVNAHYGTFKAYQLEYVRKGDHNTPESK